MVKQKINNETTLEDVRKVVDRLAIIELIKAGATRSQVREAMGSISNETFSKINQALKKSTVDKEGDA